MDSGLRRQRGTRKCDHLWPDSSGSISSPGYGSMPFGVGGTVPSVVSPQYAGPGNMGRPAFVPPSKPTPSASPTTSPQTKTGVCSPSAINAAAGAADGLFARAGSDLIAARYWLSNLGGETARAGADVAVGSAVLSAVGIPAEPGIVLGGGVAGIGAVETFAGSASEYLVSRHVTSGTCRMRIPGVHRGIRYATDRTEFEQAGPSDRG